jgi:hypothetical protein
MEVIECPENIKSKKRMKLFLGGGITNCPDWQFKMIELLKDEEGILFNPRRKKFPIKNPNSSEEQIKWEHKYLREANAIIFWFPKETLCPITLYELGAWLMTDKPLFIGVHPKYKRIIDVKIQTKLVRPKIKLFYDLESLAKEIKKFIKMDL